AVRPRVPERRDRLLRAGNQVRGRWTAGAGAPPNREGVPARELPGSARCRERHRRRPLRAVALTAAAPQHRPPREDLPLGVPVSIGERTRSPAAPSPAPPPPPPADAVRGPEPIDPRLRRVDWPMPSVRTARRRSF